MSLFKKSRLANLPSNKIDFLSESSQSVTKEVNKISMIWTLLIFSLKVLRRLKRASLHLKIHNT